MTDHQSQIVIRRERPDDAWALRRLAGLDSARLPAGRRIVAVVDGELRAALSLVDGSAIADPFAPTSELVDLLRLHAGERPRHRRLAGARELMSFSRHLGRRPSRPLA
jgi:hypothetical protein